jgi:bacterioferritin (cytochrome b1)
MTKSSAATQALQNELVALLRLTRTEAQVARVRVSQARRDEVRRELEKNARKADARSTRIQKALRQLGGTPDVFGDTLGRVTALTKVTTEQAQPLSEGLLGDLALEHQLRDRVVFTRVLAESQDESKVADLMADLEDAHTETIEWIRLRLAEVAQGGPVALAPTPTQAAVGAVTRFATIPTRRSAAFVNKAAEVLARGRAAAVSTVGSVRDTAESTVDSVRETADATEEVVSAGRDAALARAEKVSPSAAARNAAHRTREKLGTIDAADLPIKGYEGLTNAEVNEAIHGLEDAEQVRIVLSFEEAHKNRKRVLNTAQKRLTELAEVSVNA